MAWNGVVSRLRRQETNGTSDLSPFKSEDVHVLAVDDNLIDRIVIERLLKNTSCRVTAVESGTRALQYLGIDGEKRDEEFVGLKVDWIITDYCMPGMTGYELLKKIKGCSALREIPVVIMSSENVVARIDRCLEEGAEDFIVKPVKLSDVERLKQYIMRDVKERNEERTHKRKLMETSDYSPPTTTRVSGSVLSLLSSPTPTPSPSPLVSSPRSISSPPSSPPLSPTQSTSLSPSSPSPSRSSSPSSPAPPVVSSPPSPPSSPESPIRRLKTTNLE